MKTIRCLIIAAIALASCRATPAGVELPRPGEGLNVLFVGNSLTYWNALPAIVEALADSAGVEPLTWGQIAFPDYALEDHWAEGTAPREIRKGGWDIVVLQQGPSSLPENRASLIAWTRRFDEEIRRAGGRTALYMVWPQINRQQDFDNAVLSYKLAADSVNGMLMPVGDAWRAAWRIDGSIPLYSGDGLHPNVAGSYLAGLVIFQQLYGRTPVGLPARLTLPVRGSPQIGVSPELAATLQEAAAATNASLGSTR